MAPKTLIEKLSNKSREQIIAYLTLYYKLKIAEPEPAPTIKKSRHRR